MGLVSFEERKGPERMVCIGKFKYCIRGVAAVEFAIVAPFMLFMLMGIIAYGIYFGAAHSVQQLAANSARAAMGGLDLVERESLVEDFVRSGVPENGLLQADKLEVTVDAPEDNPGFIRVTVSYDASDLPIWSLYSGLPLPEKTIKRDSVIRAGGY